MEKELNTVVKSNADNLKKIKMSPLRITFMVFCLVAAGAFGIENSIKRCIS